MPKKQKPFRVAMGVKNLTEEAASDLFNAMREHFGWGGTIFMRVDAEIRANRPLTGDEWSIVRGSLPWRKGLTEILCERGWELVDAALHEAHVECKED